MYSIKAGNSHKSGCSSSTSIVLAIGSDASKSSFLTIEICPGLMPSNMRVVFSPKTIVLRNGAVWQAETSTDGYRESTEFWADVLRDLRRPGMKAPFLVVAVGDGALGFWGALSEVFPDTKHQKCWVHKMALVR